MTVLHTSIVYAPRDVAAPHKLLFVLYAERIRCINTRCTTTACNSKWEAQWDVMIGYTYYASCAHILCKLAVRFSYFLINQ